MKKLYRVFNGNMEIVQLLDEHHLCDGATQETYLVRRQDGSKATCSKTHYFASEKEAWQDYLDDLQESIRLAKNDIYEMQEDIYSWKKEVENILDRLENLNG